MRHFLTIRDTGSIDAAASEFLSGLQGNRPIAFYAPMGAGKTTFISALCRKLGVNADAISSPTFAIVNEYRGGTGNPIFHFDFYRLENSREALDIGFYDYIDSGYLCLMEWPENVEDIIPDDTLKVRISVEADGTRLLEWDD